MAAPAMMTHQRLIAPDRDALNEHASQRLEQAILSAVRRAGFCRLALSGGNTPGPVYERLASRGHIDWSKVQLFFVDERCVPPEHDASNYGMVKRALLDAAGVRASNVHRIRGEADPQLAAHEYSLLLTEPIDVVVLGIGADGHTASLFPGGPEVFEQARRAVPSRSPVAPHERITLTPPVLEAARELLMIAAGQDKAQAIARALSPGAELTQVPACLAARGAWLLDREAAALL